MILYRVASKKRANDLSGFGAKIAGGRWNPKGYSLIYSAANSSLAILEKLVHIDIDLLPADLCITEIVVDSKSLNKIEKEQLPPNWFDHPAPDYLKEIGKQWLLDGKTLMLQVPSAVNPNEFNCLINPNHSDIKKVSIKRIIPLELDQRLGR